MADEQAPQPVLQGTAVDRHQSLLEMLGRYMDPTDLKSILIKDQKIIINDTQVAATHLVIIGEEIKHLGYELEVITGYPTV